MKRINIRWDLIRLIIGCSLVIIILYIGVRSKKDGHTYTATSVQQTNIPNPRAIFNNASAISARGKHIRKLLQLSAQALMEAKMHIRSSKAKDAMLKAILLFKNVLKEFYIDVPSRIQKPNSTCPEVYHGTSFGYPFFHKGFEFQNCTNKIPVENLVSVIITCQESRHTTLLVDQLVRSVQVHNNKLSVTVAISAAQGPSDFRQLGNINIVRFGYDVSPGAILNKFTSLVSTKYTLIARDLLRLDNDSYIERLVKEIETLNATVVGGATRDENGYWKKGCHQMVHQNYSLVLQDGYTMSLHECIQCDLIEGPFLARTELFEKEHFDEHIVGPGMMEDFFLRLQEQQATSFVCPDAMFYVFKKISNFQKDDWKMLGRKWNMRRIILSTGQEINIDCPIDYKCLFWKGFSVSPCCLEELANLVNYIMASCRKIGALCELQEGTLLGAVKLDKVLPWERDADITFLSSNFSALTFLSGQFKMKGYVLNIVTRPKQKNGVVIGGKIVISSKHWHVELYGQHDMDSKALLKNGDTPTKVLLNGHWVNAPRNPGLYVRNRYGFRVYAHSEHWMATGKKTGWAEYATDSFMKCSQPGYHNCLDRYNGDGSLQFNHPVP